MHPDIARYEKNLREELDGAALYAALAGAEIDPIRKDLFLQLSQAEAGHAQLWREKLTAAGVDAERFTPSLRTRILARLAQRFGPRFVLPAIAATEFADRDKYSGQADALPLSSEERGHAAVIQAAATTNTSGMIGADIAKAEPWHRRGSGNDLRAAVLGANDGLVSNLCLVMGVAGAGQASQTILLTGLAGLVAGAVSMALGEWLSVTNAREFARSQIDQEEEELEQSPDAERKELALIFQAKGLPREEAQRVATDLMRDKRAALDTLAREELGIDPAELGGNPWSAAAFSFAFFALGAFFPVVPFFFAVGTTGMAWSLALSAAALGATGLATSLFSGRGPVYSATRQVAIGGVAAAVTYATGALIGVSLS
ncbi:MAG TPA: VIT1/CCC1 transporter family protein [Casimicrobiaceae bacterium]|jgi:VIT1/CCC1 family predicted Fe2+/Mn2+ transporter|nr:VIT1/CCC1 transporter family protein [Casimicrobiaceae bacterium]